MSSPAEQQPAEAAATRWGRIGDDGTVYVRTRSGERAVGSWQAGDAQAGLDHFKRRYDDLVTEVELLEQRLTSGAADPKTTATHARELRAGLAEASVVGDLDGLDERLGKLVQSAQAHEVERAAERAAARERSTAAKEALAVEAEQIAAHEGNWKASGDRLKTIVDEWRAIKGVDRKTDDALWRRFRAARDEFTHRRGAHFAALDEQRGAARQQKERLVQEAESLVDSSDWGPTASRLKTLMREWKEAGRAPKATDDALWTRFRAAQDAFFSRRQEVLKARDNEQLENQHSREALIAELEAVDPSDAAKAQSAMRAIQERYDGIGHVPREAVRPLDERMRAAEQRIRDAADTRRRRESAASNPLLDQMRETVAKAQSTLKKAQNAGDPTRIKDAQDALVARQEWLAEAERAAQR
jgi:hypothetical protein